MSNIPISSIPDETNVTSAKLLGVNSAGQTKLFPTANLLPVFTVVADPAPNLLDPAKYVVNRAINGSAWAIGVVSGYTISDYVPVTALKTYRVTGWPNSTNRTIMYFDAFRNKMAAAPFGVNGTATSYDFTPPAGVAFIVLNVKIDTDVSTPVLSMVLANPDTNVTKINGLNIKPALVDNAATKGGKPIATEEIRLDLELYTPARVFVACNDIRNDGQTLPNRNYSLGVYVDHCINLNGTGLTTLAIDWAEYFSDRMKFFGPVAIDTTPNAGVVVNLSNKTGSTKSACLINKSASIQQVSTKVTTGKAVTVKYLKMGDSTVDGVGAARIGANLNGPLRSYEFTRMLFEMDKIDAGSPAGNYNLVNIGAANNRLWSFSYGGTTVSAIKGQAQGIGGWSAHDYLYFANKRDASQGVWDLLGLGNGTGTDYTGTTTQKATLYASPEGAATPKNTAAFIVYMQAQYPTAGITDYTSALAKFNAVLADPVNPFFDKDKTGANRFSPQKWLDSYKTLADDGVTRLVVGTTAGTKVTNVNAWDVCLPSHVVIQLGINDSNKVNADVYLTNMQSLISAWKAINPVVCVAVSMPDSTGMYNAGRYPEFDDTCRFDPALHTNAIAFNKKLQTLDLDADKTFYLPHFFTNPTAESIPVRKIPAPDSLTGIESEDKTNFFTRYTDNPQSHMNVNGQAACGYSEYAWIKYTLSL